MVWYLRDVDPALLEGAGGGVVGAQVAVLAPVAAESAVHTRQAPGGEKGQVTREVIGLGGQLQRVSLARVPAQGPSQENSLFGWSLVQQK